MLGAPVHRLFDMYWCFFIFTNCGVITIEIIVLIAEKPEAAHALANGSYR